MIDLFLGELPEYVAEVRCVRRLVNALRGSGTPAVLFGNFVVPTGQRASRQVDLLVATDRGAWVVEVKGFRRPFEGSFDGEWWLLDPEGSPSHRLSRNPVRQADSQRFAVCDRIANSMAWRGVTVGDDVRNLVDAVVCFYPRVPPGSRVPAAAGRTPIVGFEQLIEIVHRGRSTAAWPLASWRDLAGEWRLRRFSGPLPADDQETAAWEMLDAYMASVTEWGTSLERRIDTPLRAAGQPIESGTLLDALREGRPVALVGESGTGKSLLARHLAVSGVNDGLVPLIVEARYFDGRLAPVIDDALRQHANVRAAAFRDGVRQRGLVPLVVLDGLNECPEREAPRLMRAVCALARRERVALLVTTRQTASELTAEGVLNIEVALPTEDQRHQIAVSRAPRGAPPHIMELLTSMRTPRDISVASEHTDDLSPAATLHDVYHAYCSRRLGTDDVGRAAFAALCAAAARMGDALRWTMRVSELVRMDPALSESRLFAPGVMERRGETCTFAHETVLRFFLLESLLRKTKGDGTQVVESLRRPRFRHLTSLAVCAIDEPDLLDLLLSRASDPSVIADALMGRLGRAAKQAAERGVDAVLAEHQRHRGLWRITRLAAPGRSVHGMLERPSPLSPAAEHTMGALGVVVRRGVRVDDVFGLIESSDRRCHELLSASRGEDAVDHQKDVHFRGLWLYEGGEKQLLGREIDDRPDDALLRAATARLSDVRGQPPGVLAFLCNIVSSAPVETEQHWLELCEACWASGYTHLQLDAVRLVERVLQVGAGAHRDALLNFLERGLGENVFVNSEIMEVLAYTGRVDPPVDDPGAAAQVRSCLLGERTPERCEEARGVWAQAHEDVFQGVFWNAIDELDDVRKLEFRVRAVLGHDFPDLFLPILLSHLIEADTIDAVDALEMWARRPVDTFMPDAAAETFCLAVVGLARCGVSLPPHEGTGDRGAVWAAIGRILHATHSAPSGGDAGAAVGGAWAELRSCESPVSAAMAIADVRRARRSKDLGIDWRDVLALAPAQCAQVFESAIRDYLASADGSTQPGASWLSWRITEIVRLLGETGTDRAIDLLTSISDHPDLGSAAIDAVRLLRER